MPSTAWEHLAAWDPGSGASFALLGRWYDVNYFAPSQTLFACAFSAWLSLRATRFALLQVDDGTGEAAAAQGGAFALLQVTTGRAMPQRRSVDTGTGRPGAGVGRRVVAWRWRGGGRGLWRVRCFALLQVTTGRARPQRRRAGHWHGTGASQDGALVLARGGDGANESSSAGRAGQGTGAGRGGAVVHGAAGARGMGGGGVGVVRGGAHVALLSSPVLA